VKHFLLLSTFKTVLIKIFVETDKINCILWWTNGCYYCHSFSI